MYLLFLFISLLFCSCSPPEKKQVEPLIVDRETIEFSESENSLKGTGRVLFNQPLFGLNSKEFYFLKAEFFSEDSSLVLHSHFSGFVKQDGVRVIFIRDKNKLLIKTATPDYPVQELHVIENYFERNNQLDIYVQVQNGIREFVNIKIWNAYINPTGYLKKTADFFTLQNLMTSSEDILFYSKGKGLLWGVELNKVRLMEIYRNSVSQQ